MLICAMLFPMLAGILISVPRMEVRMRNRLYAGCPQLLLQPGKLVLQLFILLFQIQICLFLLGVRQIFPVQRNRTGCTPAQHGRRQKGHKKPLR